MSEAGGTYSIDTSALIHAWLRAYPPSRFPKLWANIEELIDKGRLFASIEVYHELQKKDDEVAIWAKERKEALFRDFDEPIEKALIDLMTKYPRLVDTKKGRSGGDPFVIATAVASGGCTVVTEEKHGGVKNPKIPDVCALESIPCISLLDLINAEDWVF